MTQRTCPVCGTSFAPRTWNQKYCTGYRGRCYRRAMNVKQGIAPSLTAPLCEPYNCEWCGEHCIPGENVPHQANRFCSVKHQQRWHRRDKLLLERLNILREPGRFETAAYRRAVRADPCSYCGNSTGGIDHIDPRHAAGTDDWSNLAGCCKRCNGAKGTLSLLAALLWLPTSRQYHDLRQTLWPKAA